jgi:1-carboxybiuret hydrolase subunit AtzG-like
VTSPQKELTRAEIEAMVDASAAAIGLPIASEFRPGVLINFELAARLAQNVMAFPLDTDVEPAPVFSHDLS